MGDSYDDGKRAASGTPPPAAPVRHEHVALLEAQLAQARSQLAMALAAMEAGFIVADRFGRITQMNAAAEALTGWSLAEAKGRALETVVHTEGRPPLAAEPPASGESDPAALLAGLWPPDMPNHVMLLGRGGTRIPVELRATVTPGGDTDTQGIAVVLRDRGPQMRSSMDASRLGAIVASSLDAIISKRLDGTLLTWNAAAEKLFGYRADEVIGRPVTMLIPEGRQDEEMRILAELARGMTVRPFETQRRTKDGRLIDVSLTISPIRDADGRICGASKIVRDISERKAAEAARARAAQLEAENRQMQEAARVKGRFLATMSHELRTPLNAIIGFADLIGAGMVANDPEKTQRFVGHIATSGRHLLQLINDVLDLAKIEAGKFTFQPERVDLARLVNEVCDIVRANAQAKSIAIAASIDPVLDPIVADPVRLKQVLYNYLSNAIKFTPQGGAVAVRAVPQGRAYFRIEVEDGGRGIAPDQMKRLFREFEQLDAGINKQYAGTGLGLALTKRLVEAQGGAVGVVSTEGEGSIFHAVLKRVHQAGSDGAGTGEAAAGEPGHLLVVEDDREVRSRIMNGLAGAGFRVTAAATAEQAARLANGAPFDAVTLDLGLRDRAGLGLLAALRADAPAGTAPVIGVTSPNGTGVSVAFAIADILSKPLRADEVALAMTRQQLGARAGDVVMVIDDDPLALDLMRATLAGMGITAACFQDGRDALVAYARVAPRAVVLDLMMPQFDGFAVLDALQQLPDARATPVFIWTSMLLSDEEYATLSQSAHAIVSKGGGGIVDMLEKLRAWRPALVASGDEAP